MLTLSWYDQRLIFQYLTSEQSKNLLAQEEQARIWAPKVVFENTKEKTQTKMDEMTATTVKNFNISLFEITDDTESEVIKQYSGEENLLVSTRFYPSKFNCEFQMHWYPFDLQVCTAIFGIAKAWEFPIQTFYAHHKYRVCQKPNISVSIR